MLVSVAIPCYKSSKTIKYVVDDVIKAIKQRENVDYQIILVNDFPGDRTFDVIKKMCENDKKIIGVNLSKNFGQTSAKMAALPFVDGDVLVYMDDDGQHPADQIYKLIDKVLDGYDVVFAYFPNKKHSAFKKITSELNSRLLEFNGTKPKGIHMSSYYAISRTAVDSLIKYKSPFPSTVGYLNNVVDKYANVELEHRERIDGSSNYTLKKLLNLWFTGFTNFSIVPLRIASFMGIFTAIIGFIFGIFIVVRKILNPHIAAGYTSNISVTLFIGGCIMMILGLIGEYIGRIYMTLCDLPQYEIREIVNKKEH